MENKIAVYFAGKIGGNNFGEAWGNDWRFLIVDQKFRMPAEIYNLEYCGPNVDSDHGQVGKPGHRSICHDGNDKYGIFSCCMAGIAQCDLLFAWIFEDTCFGTLAEIGFALAKRKKIIIGFASDELLEKMWFVSKMAETTGFFGVFKTPMEALKAGLASLDMLLSAMPYSEYLKTDHWKDLSAKAKTEAGNRCQLCNSGDKALHTHHRTYERRGCEDLKDLVVLCGDCHAKFHDIKKAA